MLLLLATSPALAQFDYHYSLSASDVDPFVNQVAPSGQPLYPVHLWLYDTCDDGVAAIEFDVEVSPSLIVLTFTPLNGVLNVLNQTQLLLAVPGCPNAPFLLGEFLILDPNLQGGTMCLVPSAANGWNVSVDCSTDPTIHPNGSYGFTSDGSVPCGELTFCPLPVENRSWGQVKGLYR
jgi:hypothetical protein